ncbi:hypothetical protein LWC34_49645 [Kibdelosporangium philippinense]|uniref:DUF2905 domain-containing protein n=1 Tax=Kibdelosporangium philippinense TaxID=211113 RepID=A0ABS8ZSY3_9PSEU|nr:hypothetical protein [Kibdelosporangium philippinense]MCE7010816.1 hypothetical protein [Kibdelosporangium philippinense]
MASNSDKGWYDFGMLLCVVVGVWLGVIPLGQRLFGARQGGMFDVILGDLGLTDPWTYVVPGGFIVLFFLVIIALDAAKKRS